jgi:hypothetical protein
MGFGVGNVGEEGAFAATWRTDESKVAAIVLLPKAGYLLGKPRTADKAILLAG